MEFFDNLALPQSHEHLILLKYLLGLTFTLFMPYLAILIGASLFSIILKRKASDSGEHKYLRLARDLVNIAALNKSVVFALGIVPLISAIFCYIQLLQNSSANVVSIMITAFVAFSFGILVFFSYKRSFNLKFIFEQIRSKDNAIDNSEAKEIIEDYDHEAQKNYKNGDIWSLILFVITALLFAGSIELASNSNKWGGDYSLITTLFSLRTISYLLFILTLSVVFTSVVSLFFYYSVKKVDSVGTEYLGFVREYSIKNALVFGFLLPLFMLMNIMLTPANSLSGSLFVVAVLLLTAILIFSSFLYLMQKDREANYVNILLVLAISFFVFTNAKDQISFSSGSQKQLAQLEANFAQYEADFKSELGVAVADISGEDIYNGKCVACHQFDTKLVGPPYKDVLPKYTGDREALAEFILNPVKINPDYPAMPNQGLKPKEAKAVAEYLLETYKQQ